MGVPMHVIHDTRSVFDIPEFRCLVKCQEVVCRGSFVRGKYYDAERQVQLDVAHMLLFDFCTIEYFRRGHLVF